MYEIHTVNHIWYFSLPREQIHMIIKSLENTDWNSITNDNDINSTYDNFITKLWDTVNEYAPEKHITINKNKLIRQP